MYGLVEQVVRVVRLEPAVAAVPDVDGAEQGDLRAQTHLARAREKHGVGVARKLASGK